MTTVAPSRIIDLSRPRTVTDGHVKIAIDNRTGSPVHVRALDPRTRNGKACDCTCVGCGEPLSAKQGDVQVWHFAHLASTDCPATSETTLHLAAKAVLKTTRTIGLPRYEIGHYHSVMVAPHQHLVSNIRHALPERPAYQFASVAVEQAFTAGVAVLDDHGVWTPHQDYRLVADAVGTTGSGKSCLIEFVVTHRVDQRKEQVLFAVGHPTVEIHLDHLRAHEESPDLVARVQDHLEGLDRRHWIVPPIDLVKRAEIEARLHAQNRAEVERLVEVWKSTQG
ncbi:competence protein CoiA family protein [Paraburkholderia sp. C35]|uniref:competence protein CoiA family protein n=1 Tax=Paraburkholderia sp. C35 TaxID=2126993 RepID=UPI000D69541E|nr:competence protein CoiA family protein [Paraburkholderia sp. C35]